MSGNITTVSDRFPMIDVTHKPKRTQADNLKRAGVIADDTPVEGNVEQSKVPQSPTVEGAIQFFESNATGEFKALYKSTATWLRKYLTIKAKDLPKSLQAVLPDDTKEVIASETAETIEES